MYLILRFKTFSFLCSPIFFELLALLLVDDSSAATLTLESKLVEGTGSISDLLELEDFGPKSDTVKLVHNKLGIAPGLRFFLFPKKIKSVSTKCFEQICF